MHFDVEHAKAMPVQGIHDPSTVLFDSLIGSDDDGTGASFHICRMVFDDHFSHSTQGDIALGVAKVVQDAQVIISAGDKLLDNECFVVSGTDSLVDNFDEFFGGVEVVDFSTACVFRLAPRSPVTSFEDQRVLHAVCIKLSCKRFWSVVLVSSIIDWRWWIRDIP